jgi:DNA-binding protein HU-beta
MNKTQLATAVAERTGAGPAEARKQVDAVLDSIATAVAAGERVSLLGFGTFDSATRAARTARNPRTGAAIAVPAAVVPRFRVGAGFKARVADGSTIPVVTGTADADPGPRQGAKPSAKKAKAATPAAAEALKPSKKKAAPAAKSSKPTKAAASSAKKAKASAAPEPTKKKSTSSAKASKKSGSSGGKKSTKKGKKK